MAATVYAIERCPFSGLRRELLFEWEAIEIFAAEEVRMFEDFEASSETRGFLYGVISATSRRD